jgi:hypothetical protein
LPLVLVTIIGIYVFTQLPAITAILNGAGYINTAGAQYAYRNAAGRIWRGTGAAAVTRGLGRAARYAVSRRWQRMRDARTASTEAARASIQRGVRQNGAPLA